MLIKKPRYFRLWILFSVVLLTTTWYINRHYEEKALLQIHINLMKFLDEDNFAEAYKLTTEEYRSTHTVKEFQQEISRVMTGVSYSSRKPEVLSLGFKNAEVSVDEMPFSEFTNGQSLFYRKEHGKWCFTGETQIYLD